MRADITVAYVRDLLERITGERPEPDPDGDLPVRLGGALFYARVMGSEDAVLQMFSVALAEVPTSPDLALALNDINTEIKFARAFHVANQVLIEAEIWGDDVNPANLRHACHNIARATDFYAPLLAKYFGGEPRFQKSQEPDYPAGLQPGEAVGPYL